MGSFGSSRFRGDVFHCLVDFYLNPEEAQTKVVDSNRFLRYAHGEIDLMALENLVPHASCGAKGVVLRV